MSIENTLAKRGVTIVRRLVESDDKTDAAPRAKHASPVNGAPITPNHLAARGSTLSKSGITISNSKSPSVHLNVKNLPVNVKGGLNQNAIRRPMLGLPRGAPSPTRPPAGLPRAPGARGTPGHRFGLASPRNAAPVSKNFIPGLQRNPSGNSRVRGPNPYVGNHSGIRGQGSPAMPFPRNIGPRQPFANDARKLGPNNTALKNVSQINTALKNAQINTSLKNVSQINNSLRNVSNITSSTGTTATAVISKSQVTSKPVGNVISSIPSSHVKTSDMSPQLKTNINHKSVISSVSTSNISSLSSSKSTATPQNESLSLSKGGSAIPNTRVSEKSHYSVSEPSPKCSQASPLSRSSEMSPLARSAAASPLHRTGLTPQPGYQPFSPPTARPSVISPAISQALGYSQPSASVTSHSQVYSQSSTSTSSQSAISSINGLQTNLSSAASSQIPSSAGLSHHLNASYVAADALAYGQTVQGNSRLGSTAALGYSGLDATGFMGRPEGYGDASTLAKFQVQPGMENFASQMNSSGFGLQSSYGNQQGYAVLPGNCAYPQEVTRQYLSQNTSATLSDPFALQQCNFMSQSLQNYNAQAAAMGYNVNTCTSNYAGSPLELPNYTTANIRGISPFPILDKTIDDPVALLRRELALTPDGRQSTTPQLPIISTAHSNYSEALQGNYTMSFPKSDLPNPTASLDYRESSREYRNDAVQSYRQEIVSSSYRENPVEDGRSAHNPGQYREMAGPSGVSGGQTPARTGPETSYKEPVQNPSRGQAAVSGVSNFTSQSYRETENATFRDAKGHASAKSRDQCYRDPIAHASSRDQSMYEDMNSSSPRGQPHPNYQDNPSRHNINSQNIRYDGSASQGSPMTPGYSYKDSAGYGYRGSVDRSGVDQPPLNHSAAQEPYRTQYVENQTQRQVVAQYSTCKEQFSENSPLDLKYRQNSAKEHYAKSSMLPSFTESFECTNPAESVNMQNYAESGYVSSSRSSECASRENLNLSTPAHSVMYSPSCANITDSPSGLQNKGSPARLDAKQSNTQSKYSTCKKVTSDAQTNDQNMPNALNVSQHSSDEPQRKPDPGEKSQDSGQSLPQDLARRLSVNSEESTGTVFSSASESQHPEDVRPSCSLNKSTPVGSPSKTSGASPGSQERIVIKMKLLHSENMGEADGHDNSGASNSKNEDPDSPRYQSMKYTRWTIDSIINGRVSDGSCDSPSDKRAEKYQESSDSCSEEQRTGKSGHKNTMKPLKITIPNPLRAKLKNEGRERDSEVEVVSPKKFKSGSKSEELRKLRFKSITSPASPGSCEMVSPASTAQPTKARRPRRSSELSDASVVSVNSEQNENSSVAQVKNCSIVIKRIYSADNSSSYSSSLSKIKSEENEDDESIQNRPKRKAALEANERCHKSLRSLDRYEINTNKVPYNAVFCKSKPLMPVNLSVDSGRLKTVVTRCSVKLYDVFMNRRINSMVCPGCSRNYDSSDSVQVNMRKATISLLCSSCRWLVVKDAHPREVESLAPC